MKSETAKIFFGTNVKFLRNRTKQSQESLAELLKITRAKLNAWENDVVKSPLPEDYIRVSNHFRISIDSLLRVDLSKLGELNLRKLEGGEDVYLRGGKLRVLSITVDQHNRENVEVVPLKAKAGYLSGFSDPEYISSLPKMHMPMLPQNGSFRIFEIEGNSMLPLAAGSHVITRFVQDWTELKSNTSCIVISTQHGLVYKNVTIEKDGNMLLRSLNTEYDPYRLPIDEVDELWSFHGYISYRMPEVNDLGFIAQTLIEVRDHLKLKDKND
ncbi:helix-turn-helix domain-containing protein [uncultured Pedobacter sp.]|uniref:XRE family transcriptional regulator n=1 Tax=uncultured Pedobacter sp. TaxID=246139 RepID=UPI00261A71A5|nr:helix-turn-helix domain-containing protein [uncultured Pedobacter sp.]